ncbi:MAG: hypothetical protein AAFQ20_16320, partial [Bacteroidota bacterium]
MRNKQWIDKFAFSMDEMSMDKLINLAKNDKLKDEEVLYLATVLAKSGRQLKIPNALTAADIPSTGGPSSLSTLICPLILRELGFLVPKLGVPGRPAGAIDILYQIPGYKVDFNSDELNECLKKNGYCHFLAGDNFTPADAKFFQYRAKVNATSVPPLVIASILSKKIAVGLKLTGLDIRVSKSGNLYESFCVVFGFRPITSEVARF